MRIHSNMRTASVDAAGQEGFGFIIMDNKVVEADDLEMYVLLEVYNAQKITLMYGVVSVNLIGMWWTTLNFTYVYSSQKQNTVYSSCTNPKNTREWFAPVINAGPEAHLG